MRYLNAALIAGAMILGSNAYAQTSGQFDLICTGTAKDVKGVEKPWTQQFSVDLNASKFCFIGCKAPSSIARVEPDRIFLKDAPPGGTYDKDTLWISRADGSARGLVTSRRYGIVDSTVGACTLGPFTPLSTTLF